MPIDIYSPRTMGAVIKRMPPKHSFIRDTFFKKTKTFLTPKVEFDFKKGNRELAPFVSPVIGGKTIKNSGFQTKDYTAPLIAPNKITTADELMDRRAGENPYSGKSPAERGVEKLVEDFQELTEMIDRREEWMAATALFTGKIPIIGDGVNEVIDFNFTNTEKPTAAKKWSATGSDPIADLKFWRAKVQQKGFVNCNICIMAADVVEVFINHEKVKSKLDVKQYDLAVIRPRELPSGATYIGTINEIAVDIYQYNEWYLDNWTNPLEPTTLPLVPEKKLGLFSTQAQYSMLYGAHTYIDEKTGAWVNAEGRIIPTHWIERNPDRKFIAANSRPLPVPHEVDSWLIAEVL